ncbi:MAG: carbon starvation protein A [Planctomycetota bacterium]|nr:carbon starvation protein A [Planctomycetota bacterium]
METFAIAVGSLVLYIVAYHTYGRWLSRKIFRLDAKAAVPSKQLNDGQDYVPTRKAILFGHHFTSIAGTGPIVGPALAVIWGWLPALLWVLFGSIFIGAVHDLGALVVSIRNRGQTIGEVAGRLINPRVKILFLLILFLALTIVLAIFGLVIASIFAMYPASVLAVWLAMPVAIVVGILIYKKGISPHVPALIALLIMIGAIVLAAQFEFLQLKIQPFTIAGLTISPIISWTLALFVYCYFASVLPVWLLLQPRDYVNSYLLILGLLLLVCGIGAATFFTEGGAPMVAPMVRTEVAGAPPIMPFLFVTIACGAISGFHCLVSSGTSSKQIACETDAQFIGYGSMLTEGFLAVLVILACCAGLGLRSIPNPVWTDKEWSFGVDNYSDGQRLYFSFYPKTDGEFDGFYDACLRRPDGTEVEIAVAYSRTYKLERGESAVLHNGLLTFDEDGQAILSGPVAWQNRYDSWSAAGGLAAKVGAFVEGAANFVASLGIPIKVAVALMAVLVASFAATTLDTATRLQRYVIQELASTANIRPLTTKHGATLLAVGAAAIVAAIPPPGQTWATGMGKGGLILWPIFGATNQLLAGLAFMVVLFYFARRKLPTWFIAGPAVLMLVVPFFAMLYQLGVLGADGWWQAGEYHLVVAGVIICALEVWMVAEAIKLWPRIIGVLETDLPPLPRGFPVAAV